MMPYLKERYGNPNSLHSFGQEAMFGVDQARQEVAAFLNSLPEEIIFTSGATESNNLVIKGLLQEILRQNRSISGGCRCSDQAGSDEAKFSCSEKGSFTPHIITSSVEHKAVLRPCAQMEEQGVELSYLPVDKKGVVNVEELENSIKENTVLVSIMYVNSEVGSVQPIQRLGKIIKKINEQRLREWQKRGAKKKLPRPQRIHFHTDATQALNFYSCDVRKLRLDFLSFSGHKIYGPKGVGALYVRQGSRLSPLQSGGQQEKNLRSGTLNTPGIVGLGKAVSLLTPEKQEKNNQKIAKLRDYLVEGLTQKIPDIYLTTDRRNSTPAHAHVIFRGAEGESVLVSLDLEGIAVSTGSACASQDLHPSYVLEAMGVKAEEANSCIRFSLGKHTTKKEIDQVIKVLPGIVERIRQMNPIYKNK